MNKPLWVLDTNVVLDLLHFAEPTALPILDALLAGHIECRTSAATLAELQRVLGYPEFGLDAAAQAAIRERYDALARCVEAQCDSALPRCRDADDQKFLELAAAAAAGVLVSRDRALLRLAGRRQLPFRILSPARAAADLAADAMLAASRSRGRP
ncbi:MAG: putative toxin-antitoxin system toxin component, PIN family [Gammaproteobacteria bacterium]